MIISYLCVQNSYFWDIVLGPDTRMKKAKKVCPLAPK